MFGKLKCFGSLWQFQFQSQPRCIDNFPNSQPAWPLLKIMWVEVHLSWGCLSLGKPGSITLPVLLPSKEAAREGGNHERLRRGMQQGKLLTIRQVVEEKVERDRCRGSPSSWSVLQVLALAGEKWAPVILCFSQQNIFKEEKRDRFWIKSQRKMEGQLRS